MAYKSGFIMSLCLITGASYGLGKEFSYIHASLGGDLILTARSQNVLNKLREELISTYKVRVFAISCDLSCPKNALLLYEKVKKLGLEPDIVINNAACGCSGEFVQIHNDDLIALLNLNVTSLALLSLHFLQDMKKRGFGKILNISSITSLMPGPYMAPYYASKSFVTSLSLGLAEECRSYSKISITTLIAGPLDTNFVKASHLKNSRLKKLFTANAHDTAKKAYYDLMLGKRKSYAGMTKIVRALTMILPLIPEFIKIKIVAKLQK